MKSLLTVIDQKLLDEISLQARQSPRLRRNHNFHPADDFSCHRLLNAMEPGSYIRPHRHLDPAKDESIMMLRGRIGIVEFDGEGNLVMAKVMAAGGAAIGIDIPHGVFHTLVCLEEGSVFFEAKAGPYRPLDDAEKGVWSPEEGSSEAQRYLASLASLFPGGEASLRSET